MCAWVCHPNKNTPALTRSNLVSEYKIEKEANYFATKLLVDGSHIEDFVTGKYDVLKYYVLPKSFERFLWTFFQYYLIKIFRFLTIEKAGVKIGYIWFS